MSIASYNSASDIEIKTFNQNHTCTRLAACESSSAANQQVWQRRVMPEHLFITRTAKCSGNNRLSTGTEQTPSYKAAWRVWKYLIEDM